MNLSPKNPMLLLLLAAGGVYLWSRSRAATATTSNLPRVVPVSGEQTAYKNALGVLANLFGSVAPTGFSVAKANTEVYGQPVMGSLKNLWNYVSPSTGTTGLTRILSPLDGEFWTPRVIDDTWEADGSADSIMKDQLDYWGNYDLMKGYPVNDAGLG